MILSASAQISSWTRPFYRTTPLHPMYMSDLASQRNAALIARNALVASSIRSPYLQVSQQRVSPDDKERRANPYNAPQLWVNQNQQVNQRDPQLYPILWASDQWAMKQLRRSVRLNGTILSHPSYLSIPPDHLVQLRRIHRHIFWRIKCQFMSLWYTLILRQGSTMLGQEKILG